MAKIYEARIDHNALGAIEVAPPKREGGWVWGLLLVAFLIGGAAIGLTSATGSISNAVHVAQNGFAANGTGDTATN